MGYSVIAIYTRITIAVGIFMSDKSNNNEPNTVAVPPSDLLKIKLLDLRERVLEAIHQVHVYKSKGAGDEHAVIKLKPSIKTMFYSLNSALKRGDRKSYDDLKGKVDSDKLSDLLDSFEIMDDWLDRKRIIRVDNIADYDSTRAESENLHKGLS